MKLFKNQAGTSDVVLVSIILGIIGALFITGVFVWQKIDNDNKIYVSGHNPQTDRQIYTGIDYNSPEAVSCKAGGGSWRIGTMSDSSMCAVKWQFDIDNPYYKKPPSNYSQSKIEDCACDDGYCWDGESCVSYDEWKKTPEN